jgi:hypothetical protein
MSGLRFVFSNLSLLRTIIMLFIRSTSNCGFVRRNHQRRVRLKRLFKLCSLLIGSYNINTGLRTTNTMLTSFVTYSRLRSMMNLLLRIITNVVLELLLSLRFITMIRKQVLLRIHLQRRMVGLQGTATIGRKIESYQSRWKRMVPLRRGIICNTRHVELSSIQLRSVVHLSTLCPCTRNP